VPLVRGGLFREPLASGSAALGGAVFRYLELSSLNLLMADLRQQGLVTKLRTLKTGKSVGGIPFTRGPLAHLLRNRFYVGEVSFKGDILQGEQPAIIE
jgi:site-specific DNA recombinase